MLRECHSYNFTQKRNRTAINSFEEAKSIKIIDLIVPHHMIKGMKKTASLKKNRLKSVIERKLVRFHID